MAMIGRHEWQLVGSWQMMAPQCECTVMTIADDARVRSVDSQLGGRTKVRRSTGSLRLIIG